VQKAKISHPPSVGVNWLYWIMKLTIIMKYSKIRIVITFLLAVLVAFAFASIFHTQFVLNELVAIGTDIPMMVRIKTTIKDLIGLAPGYGAIILIGLLVGFSIIGLLLKFIPLWPQFAFTVGGALSFAAMHALMHPLFDVTLIAGARSTWGFSFQCLAGAIAGFLFASLLHWAKRRRHIFR